MKKTHIVVLAGGSGSRMYGPKTKVLMPLAGKAMLSYCLELCEKISSIMNCDITVVASAALKSDTDFKQIIDYHNKNINLDIVIQKEQNGTADAVMCATKNKISDNVLILYGDVPLIRSESIISMMKKYNNTHNNYALISLLFESDHHLDYGRAFFSKESQHILQQIVEHSDCSEAEKKCKLFNSGIMLCEYNILSSFLDKMQPSINSRNKKEFYLTDIVNYINTSGKSCSYVIANEEEALGANDYVQLAKLEDFAQRAIADKLMRNGVRILNPNTIHFHHDTLIEPGVELHSNIFFGKNVIIKSGATIKSFSHIVDSEICENSTVGPFANIRNSSKIGKNSKIGSFVETKNVDIDAGVKASHLAYLGDAVISKDVNIGAGVVICNYDGFKKHQSKIESGVFVGSNSSIISPITIHKDAFIAAGSVITLDVPESNMAISRPVQINKQKNDGLSLRFTKMHGLGNDFIIIYDDKNKFLPDPDKISRISDRNFGVGCDQLLVLSQINETLFKMQVYNSDGSSASACGNGSRCAAFFLHAFLKKPSKLSLIVNNTTVHCEITDCHDKNNAKVKTLIPVCKISHLNHHKYQNIFHVNVGNDHIVILINEESEINMEEAKKISTTEAEKMIGAQANVTFALVQDHGISAKIYEKGAGETKACGSAAAATSIVAHKLGKLGYAESSTNIKMEGGVLYTKVIDNNVLIEGDASFVFQGQCTY